MRFSRPAPDTFVNQLRRQVVVVQGGVGYGVGDGAQRAFGECQADWLNRGVGVMNHQAVRGAPVDPGPAGGVGRNLVVAVSVQRGSYIARSDLIARR